MHQEGRVHVGRCDVCDQVRSLMTTSQGAKYLLVMVECFSKWIELAVLLQNSSKLAARAFLDCVLARFGAPHRPREEVPQIF